MLFNGFGYLSSTQLQVKLSCLYEDSKAHVNANPERPTDRKMLLQHT